MQVDISVTQTKKVKRDIDLPYCARHDKSFFYRINSDQSILKLSLVEQGAWGAIEIVEPASCIYNTTLATVIDATPCDESEVYDCAMKIHELVEKRLESKLMAV